MKKIIKLTESDLKKIISKVIKEQTGPGLTTFPNLNLDPKSINPYNLKFGAKDKPNDTNGPVHKLQQKLMDSGFLKTKSNIPTGYFGNLTKNALSKYYENNGVNREKTKMDSSNKPKDSVLSTNKPKDSVLSTNIDTGFQNKFKLSTLSDKDSIFVCKAGQENCGQFVNDFSKKLSYVGNAWLAHDLDQVGKRVMSSYTSLNPKQIEKISNIFKQIEKQGGPKERKSGGQVENIKSLQQELIKPVSASNLKVDDIVGIYYPPSGHHEEAFHQAGKPYFVSDGKGGWNKGNNLSSGKGFGLNTHVGIVGAVKNGIPLIFHNISGDVYSDPYNKLRGGGEIAWIKRS